jgi:hypothetical protein
MRNLQRGVAPTYEPIGATFSLTDLDSFKQQAIAWLGDRTELASKTINAADWAEIYECFKFELY